MCHVPKYRHTLRILQVWFPTLKIKLVFFNEASHTNCFVSQGIQKSCLHHTVVNLLSAPHRIFKKLRILKIFLQHAMLFESMLPTWELLLKLESILTNPAATWLIKFMEYYESFVISTMHTTSSPGVHLQKPISVLIHKKQLLICQIWSWHCSNSVPSPGSTLNSHSLLSPPYLQWLPPMNPWTPQSYPWGLKSTSSKFLLILILWPSTNHEHS